MNQLIFNLTTNELQELVESSVRKAIQVKSPTPIPSDQDTLLDTKEAAVFIRYKESSIYGLVKRKKIPYLKIEGKLLFSKNKLTDWLNSGLHPETARK